MLLNDVVAQTLRAHSVEVMFGLMGDANMYIADSFHRLEGGQFIAAANEGGAVLMAAAYASVADDVGVATVTHGAILNCVTGLFEAARGGNPVLVISGDTAREEAFHLQNLPQRDIVVPTGAVYREVRSPDTISVDVAAALAEARARRGPVVLAIPSDFQLAESAARVDAPGAIYPGVTTPMREDLEEVASMVLGAKRPVVIAGRGVSATDALHHVSAFAERLGAPVATTLRGKGLFDDDPFNLGICGTLSHPIASEVIGAADCIIAFGAGLSALTTLKGDLVRGKSIIQIDISAEKIGRFWPATIAVVADAGATAIALTELLDEAEVPPLQGRSDSLRERLAQWHAQDRTERGPDTDLDITGVLQLMDEIVEPDRSLTIDGGRFSHEALRNMTVQDPRFYAHCLNIGHIGLGVSSGIGAAVARPHAPCLVIVGDGGFMLGGLTELNTAVRYGLNVVVCLLNDSAYGAEYYRFIERETDASLTTFEWPSFAAIASSLGAKGIRVTHWSDFDEVRSAVANLDGPLVVEVVLDRDTVPSPGEH
ncbi:thiamine pyrophosphate-binding protein [Microbacterium sp. KRD172]|uniref:thiamine pyrophosphate-binding protein n=1 Tax=Microbacterium sp. KRD172 TaxID=2729727 RepID=UPI0019D143CA|nr:thiamine pyrophosphate-binding protein [Microbacterium sp. KRD172]